MASPCWVEPPDPADPGDSPALPRPALTALGWRTRGYQKDCEGRAVGLSSYLLALWGRGRGRSVLGSPELPWQLPLPRPSLPPGSRLRAGPSLPRRPGLPCQTGVGIGASVPCGDSPSPSQHSRLCLGARILSRGLALPQPALLPVPGGPDSVFQGAVSVCQTLVP